MRALQLPLYLKLPAQMPVLDHEQIQMLTSVDNDGDYGLLNGLIALFITHNELRLTQVEKTCQQRDVQTLRKHAHFLAGSTANLGILRVSHLCRQVECAIMDGIFNAFDQFPEQLWGEYHIGLAQIKAIAKMS